MSQYIGAAGCNFMKRLLVIFALLPALALAGTPLALKYDSQTGATTDIPSSLTKINFPAGFQLQVAGVPIGSSSFSTITGNPSDNANLSAALAAKAGASLGINQFAGGAGAYRILSVVAADEIDTRILGLTAGNTAQKLYSSGTTRSTTHFAHAVDLTCVSLQTAGNWQGTAISPRHIVTANHINPANGTTITFVAADGTNVSRTLSNSSRIGSTDIQIGLLSSDLPTSIVPARVISSAQEATLSTGSPLVFVDQAQKIFIGERNTSAESTNSFVVQQAGTSPRSTFWKSGGLVTGDSGGAIGAIIDGVYVAMSEMHTANSSTQLSGDSIARNYAAINSAMTSLGGSYQLTAFKSQVLPAFLIGTQNAPLINSATGAYNLLDSATDSPALTYNSDDAVYTLTAPGQFRTALSLGTITSTGTSADNKGASYGILASDDNSVVFYYDAAADGWAVSDPSTFRVALGLDTASTPSFNGISIIGTAGAGFIDLPAQSSSPNTPATSHIRLFNTSGNKFGWIGASGFVRTFDGTLTASRTFTLPDASTSFSISAQTLTFSGPTAPRTFTFPDANATLLTSNAAVTAAQGGTGIASYAVGDLLYASASTTLSRLADVATGSVLISGGVTTVPAWSSAPTFVGTNLTGAAASLTAGNATKWTTGRTIALTGDVTYTSGSLDGSGNVTGTSTLANIPAISGVNLTNLNATNLASGTVATARLGSGTANSTTVLYGDQTYKTVSPGLTIGSTTIASGSGSNKLLYDNSGTLAESGSPTLDSLTISGGGLIVSVAGNSLTIKGGSNAKIGSGTLVGGTATISNTSVTANSKIFLQDTSTSITNVGVLTVSSKTAGTGFVVTSTLALDMSTFDYFIVESN